MSGNHNHEYSLGPILGELQTLQLDRNATGIYKGRTETVIVTTDGIISDHQADKRYHRGPEKTLHQYAVQSYSEITRRYPSLIGSAIPGNISENITSTNLYDASVYIGDIYRIGDVLIQVSQPRSPCWKINHKSDIEKLSVFIEKMAITGWYYRVLQSESIKIGDSIESFIKTYSQHRPNLNDLKNLNTCKGLSHQWNEKLVQRIRYLEALN